MSQVQWSFVIRFSFWVDKFGSQVSFGLLGFRFQRLLDDASHASVAVRKVGE